MEKREKLGKNIFNIFIGIAGITVGILALAIGFWQYWGTWFVLLLGFFMLIIGTNQIFTKKALFKNI